MAVEIESRFEKVAALPFALSAGVYVHSLIVRGFTNEY
jgi:hypothetical protein